MNVVTCALPKVADTIRLFCTAGLVLGFVTFIQVSINFLDLMILKIKNMADWWYSVKPFHCEKSLLILSFFGLYFPAFGMTTEIYSVNLRIKSKCRKIRTRKTPNTDTFCPGIRKLSPKKSENQMFFDILKRYGKKIVVWNGLMGFCFDQL